MNFLLNTFLFLLIVLLQVISFIIEPILFLLRLIGLVKPDGVYYKLSPSQNWALALAHPLAEKHVEQGYAEETDFYFVDDLEETMRPVLLLYFGLRNNLKDEDVKKTLFDKLRKNWYRLDMDALRATDDRHKALAFACARITFSVRVAYLYEWINEEQQWFILEQNAQRARDCFNSWEDYANAWSKGRKQWITQSRADSLGVSFDQQKINVWLNDSNHPWNTMAWSLPTKSEEGNLINI